MFKSKVALISFLSGFTFFSCKSQIAIDDISKAPKITENDEQFADVFKPLDGKWKGNFKIYEDQNRQSKTEMDLNNISLKNFENPNLKLVGEIEVEQIYYSESPYFQTVEITDFYPKKNEKVVSRGVNKIQNGKMWCVVKKPDETVIHAGSTEGKETIIWQRSEQNPQKVEYFRETVLKNTYEILGWGYYEGDDLNLTPKFWFYGKYNRQKK